MIKDTIDVNIEGRIILDKYNYNIREEKLRSKMNFKEVYYIQQLEMAF